MSIRKQSLPLLLAFTLSLVWLTPGRSDGRDLSASIQATAHVEPSLGLIDAVVELKDDLASGSHLYWLYYPRHDGIVLQISRPMPVGEAESKQHSTALVNFLPEILREYPQVSLVDLSGAADAGADSGTTVTLTLIFTNN